MSIKSIDMEFLTAIFFKIYDFFKEKIIDPFFKDKQAEKAKRDNNNKFKLDCEKIYASMVKFNDNLKSDSFGRTAKNIGRAKDLNFLDFSDVKYVLRCLESLRREGKVNFEGRTGGKPDLWSVVKNKT